MPNQSHSVSRLRKLWKPAVATTLAIWFEEIIAFVADFIAVIFIALTAGLIFLYKTYVFKSVQPGLDESKKSNPHFQAKE
ncbi:MAG: hypothetical protein NTW69_20995 [Chloroflexi bacterium]|nr:hypothetical protein [Chloroflexota bacterium]